MELHFGWGYLSAAGLKTKMNLDLGRTCLFSSPSSPSSLFIHFFKSQLNKDEGDEGDEGDNFYAFPLKRNASPRRHGRHGENHRGAPDGPGMRALARFAGPSPKATAISGGGPAASRVALPAAADPKARLPLEGTRTSLCKLSVPRASVVKALLNDRTQVVMKRRGGDD